MWLVVGLGNPGAKYESTRHNIGFMVADALAGGAKFSKKFQGLIADVNMDGERVLLLKPQTFMNNSGTSVEAAVNFYKIPLDHMIVMHDELDLPVGKLRIKQGGGNNGHNGLRDIDAVLGADYWRMRLGILHPGKEHVTDHVLGEFNKAERAIVGPFIEELAKNFPLFWQHSPAGLMNKMALSLEKEEENGV